MACIVLVLGSPEWEAVYEVVSGAAEDAEVHFSDHERPANYEALRSLTDRMTEQLCALADAED